MNEDNKAEIDTLLLEQESGGHCNTDKSNTSKQFSYQQLHSFPLPRNWSHIERLKNQRNKIQAKLLEQSFTATSCYKKEIVSREDNVASNVEETYRAQHVNKDVESNDEDYLSSDSEGHLVIDDESKHSDIQLDQPEIQTPIHIHKSKSENNATNLCVPKVDKSKRSSSMSDCTARPDNKDLCELKVATINNSFFTAISGTGFVTNTSEDGRSSPHTKTESLKIVVPRYDKNSSETTKKKIKSYLIASNKRIREKLQSNEERKTLFNAANLKGSLQNESNDVPHPKPDIIILENECSDSNNLPDKLTISKTQKDNLNEKNVTKKDQSGMLTEQLLKQGFGHDSPRKAQDVYEQNCHPKEQRQSLDYGFGEKNDVRMGNAKCDSECTITRNVDSTVIEVGNKPEINVKNFMLNSTKVQCDMLTAGTQPRASLSSWTPMSTDSEQITSCLPNVVVTTVPSLMKEDNMRSLLTVGKQMNEPNTDYLSRKPIGRDTVTETLPTARPTEMYTKPLQFQKSPSILVPVAIQTTIGHPFALSSMPDKAVTQTYQNQSAHQVNLGKPLFVVVDKMNQILPQTLNKFLIFNPVTSAQTLSSQVTGLPKGQMFLTPFRRAELSGKLVGGTHKGVLQPMHNLPVLQVVSTCSPTSAISSKSFPSLATLSNCSLPTHATKPSACGKIPRTAVCSTPKKSASLEKNVCQGSENKLQENIDIKQIVSPNESKKKITDDGKKTGKSKNRRKYLKDFKEIATWNKCDENENMIENTMSDSNCNDSFDNGESIGSQQICPTPGKGCDLDMQDNRNDNTPFSPTICPLSQNRVISVDSDSDQSYDSIDMDSYRQMKSDKSLNNRGGVEKEDSHEQCSGVLNENIKQNYEKSGLTKTVERGSECFGNNIPSTVAQNSEFKCQSSQFAEQKTSSSLQKDILGKCKEYNLIDQSNKQGNIQTIKSSPENKELINEDQLIEFEDFDKESDISHDIEVSIETNLTLKETDISSVKNRKGLHGSPKSKMRQENTQIEQTNSKDNDNVIEDKNTRVRCENEQIEIQTDAVSPMQTDPVSPEVSDDLSPDVCRTSKDDKEQKRFLRTKFIILKGEICDKWLHVKKKAGFGNVPDPGFVHYLLDMVEMEKKLDAKLQKKMENQETLKETQDISTTKGQAKKRPAEYDGCQDNIKHQTKKPKLQSPSSYQKKSHVQGFLSKSVQKQINWAVNVFREWLKSLGDTEMDFEYQNTSWLNLMLERFYREARTIDNTPYSREDLQNLRRCLSVYLDGFPESNSVTISIQLDPGFYTSNQVLANLIKTRIDLPPDDSTSYISKEDFLKMYTSETLSDKDPASLLWKVWFDVCFHLCNKDFPENFLKSLKKHHLHLQSDIKGVYYTFIDTDYLSLPSDESYRRMYATPECPDRCPVRSTTVYISKLCNSCDAFFQCPNTNWYYSQLWYRPIPLTLTKLNSIMQNISAKAKLSQVYTTSDVFATWVKYKDIKNTDKGTCKEIE